MTVQLPENHLVISIAVGALAALLVWSHYTGSPNSYSDFDQIWLGGRAMLAGENPYLSLTDYRWPPFYPLPAYIIGIPFAPLSLMAARCTFAFLTASLATWAVYRHQRAALFLLLVSGPFLYAIVRGQWSPLVLAACLIPAWGFVVAVKPTVGLGAIAYYPTRVALIGAGTITLISLMVLPRWPLDWIAAIGEQRHLRMPLLLPGGILLATALLRWRRPEARLLLVLAAVPQTVVPYELVPLALVPRTRREILLIAVAWVAVYFLKVVNNPAPHVSHAALPADYYPYRWWAMLVFGYLPILALILRRPNIGEVRFVSGLIRRRFDPMVE